MNYKETYQEWLSNPYFDEDTKNVMYLRIFGNFEYNEIAEIMNKTSNWARVVFFRGKQKLKEELENEK